MIAKLGPGLLGLVVASLIAAYMSTIGTHLNWGSSYVVNDFYKRFVRKDATEKEMVAVGRICTVVLMVIAGTFALTFMENAGQTFQIMLLSGAGTGAIYILRWFWWRINAWTEISAMAVAFILAVWIVGFVGEDGTIKWYINSSAVKDHVYVIEDADAVSVINDQIAETDKKIASLNAVLAENLEEWEEAIKVSDDARDIAREVYDANYEKLTDAKSAASVVNLVNHIEDRPWSADLNKFYTDQRTWQMERDNARRAQSNLDPLPLEDIGVDFVGMIDGAKIYVYHPVIKGLAFSVQLLICVVVVTIVWIVTTLVTKPANKETLRNFYRLCHPGGPGWKKVVVEAQAEGINIDEKNAIGDWKLPLQILCVFFGCVAIYASLFSVGNFVYGNSLWGYVLAAVAVVSTVALFMCFGKIGIESDND